MSCTNHHDREPVLIGMLIPEIRVRLVTHLVNEVHTCETDLGDALLMLDLAGLTSNREILTDALAAKAMSDGLRDGIYDPWSIDPQLPWMARHEAIEMMSTSFDDQFADCVQRLAQPAPGASTPLPSPAKDDHDGKASPRVVPALPARTNSAVAS